MPDATTFSLFLTAAIVLAISPGPGIFYVLTRSINGGRSEGFASVLGTATGGLVHVVAAAFGLSIVIATSAVAFTVVKYAGAAYLIYLGVRTLLHRDDVTIDSSIRSSNARNAAFQGIVTEVLNPKTAIFFLAFIPQFIDPAQLIFPQFLLLGCISVLLNSSVDVLVVLFAGPLGQRLEKSIRLRRGQKIFSGSALIGLGAFVAVTDNQH